MYYILNSNHSVVCTYHNYNFVYLCLYILVLYCINLIFYMIMFIYKFNFIITSLLSELYIFLYFIVISTALCVS